MPTHKVHPVSQPNIFEGTHRVRYTLCDGPPLLTRDQRDFIRYLDHYCVGHNNALPGIRIAGTLGWHTQDPSAKVRGVKTDLVHRYGATIGSCERGYFVIRAYNDEDERIAWEFLKHKHFLPMVRTMRIITPSKERMLEMFGQTITELEKEERKR